MPSISSIKSKLKAKLQSVTEARSGEVYDYIEVNPNGYPSISFALSSVSGNSEDNITNMRQYNFDFIIKIPVESTNANTIEKAEQRLVEIVEEIISVIDNDRTLDATVLDTIVQAIECSYIVGDGGTFRVASGEIQVLSDYTLTTL